MRKVYVQSGPILLGRQGENQALAVVWQDIAAQYAALYGEGTFQLMVERCGDAAPYPAALTRDGDSLVWTVSDSDTAKSGVGRCELTYLVDGAVAKSKTWQTQVLASFTADGSAEPPDPAQSWVQEVLEAAAAAGKSAEEAADSADKAEDASVHAPQIGTDGTWETWDQASGAYEDVGNTQVATGTFIGEQDQFEVSDAEIVKVGQKFIVTIDGESTTYTASAVTEQEGSIQFGTTTYEQIESGNPPENGYIFCFCLSADKHLV